MYDGWRYYHTVLQRARWDNPLYLGSLDIVQTAPTLGAKSASSAAGRIFETPAEEKKENQSKTTIGRAVYKTRGSPPLLVLLWLS